MVISDDTLYFMPYMAGDMDLHLVHDTDWGQLTDMVYQDKFTLRSSQLVLHLGSPFIFVQTRKQVMDGVLKLINALGAKKPDMHLIMSLLIPRMVNFESAKPYVKACNGALKTAVWVMQRRFHVWFVELYRYFLSQDGGPEQHYFMFAQCLDSDDKLERAFKLQDQISDPSGIWLNQQGVVTWRIRVADAFNCDPREPTPLPPQ